MPMRVKKLAAWRWARIYIRRKSPLILPEVVMTAGWQEEEVALAVIMVV
jgi:hypothetical protein